MRLSQISDRTLEEHDLSRPEAREEARAGRLWASSRFDVAVAPDEAAARWALEAEQVERVTCSTLPEEVLDELGVNARVRRELRRRSRQIRTAGSRDPAIGRPEVILPPIGESAWGENSNGLGGSGLQAEAISWMGASCWAQSTSTHDGVHPYWPSTMPFQWERIAEIYEADE